MALEKVIFVFQTLHIAKNRSKNVASKFCKIDLKKKFVALEFTKVAHKKRSAHIQNKGF